MIYILLAVVVVCNLLSAWVLQLLWNWLMVSLFGLAAITFWQALGLLLLLTIVGSFFKSTKA